MYPIRGSATRTVNYLYVTDISFKCYRVSVETLFSLLPLNSLWSHVEPTNSSARALQTAENGFITITHPIAQKLNVEIE